MSFYLSPLFKNKKTEEKRTVSSFFVFEMLETAYRLALLSPTRNSHVTRYKSTIEEKRKCSIVKYTTKLKHVDESHAHH